jgi:hypothetical protein
MALGEIGKHNKDVVQKIEIKQICSLMKDNRT